MVSCMILKIQDFAGKILKFQDLAIHLMITPVLTHEKKVTKLAVPNLLYLMNFYVPCINND